MESGELHAFLTNGDAPIRIRFIQLQKELAMCQFLNLIYGKRYRAGIRLDALVDKSVDADSKFMIWIILRLPWC